MKGFLNKVQTKVTGGKTGNGEGKPVAANGEGKMAAAGPGIEATPKADIMLPKKHDKR